jgi:hypothetical protein
MHSVNSVYIATVTVRAITVRVSNKVLHFFFVNLLPLPRAGGQLQASDRQP